MNNKILQEYCTHLKARGLAKGTIKSQKQRLTSFFSWLNKAGITELKQINKQAVESYQAYVFGIRQDNGLPLSFGVQRRYLTAVRDFLAWSVKRNILLFNPAETLDLPRLKQALPKEILNPDDIEKLLQVPKISTSLGLRNRAMLELLYATGLRRSEIARLKLNHINFDDARLHIRNSKAAKDRIIPVSKRALGWIERYLEESRPKLLKGKDTKFVFLSFYGKTFHPNQISYIVKKSIKKADIGKTGSTHTLRHSFATIMLENDTDIRHIQEMLGHKSLATTQIYTRVSIARLKEAHSKTHPTAHRRGKIVVDQAKLRAQDEPSSLSCQEPLYKYKKK